MNNILNFFGKTMTYLSSVNNGSQITFAFPGKLTWPPWQGEYYQQRLRVFSPASLSAKSVAAIDGWQKQLVVVAIGSEGGLGVFPALLSGKERRTICADVVSPAKYGRNDIISSGGSIWNWVGSGCSTFCFYMNICRIKEN